MKRIVADDETCPSCGGPIIYWLPDHIGIANVAKSIIAATTVSGQERVDTNAPLHPGRYCELGCIGQLFNFGKNALREQFEADRRQRESASIVVRPVSPMDTPMKDFKIYVDRYIRGTSPRNRGTVPKHCQYLELEPGDHTLVVRDNDHLRPDRRESNTVQFTIEPQQQITFSLAAVDGELLLHNDG